MEQARLPLSKMSWRGKNPLRTWRTIRDLSQADVASIVSLSTKSISAYEQGSTMPTPPVMMKLAILMGMNAEQLTVTWKQWRKSRRPR